MESHFHFPNTYQENMDWRSSSTTFPCNSCKYKAADSRDPSGLVDYIFTGADDGLDENDLSSFNTVPFDYSYPWVDQTQAHESLIENVKKIQSNWNEFDYTSSFGKEAADRRFVAGGVPDQHVPNYGRSWANANSFEDMIFSGENNNVDVTSSFIEAICNYEDGDAHRVPCNGTRSRWPASDYEDNSFSSWDVMGLIDNILNVACPAIKALGNFIGDVFDSRKVHICVNDLGSFGRRRRVNDFGSSGRQRPGYPLVPTDIDYIPTAPSKPDKLDEKEGDGFEFYPSVPNIPDKKEGDVYNYFRKDAQKAQELANKYSKDEEDARANGDHTSANRYKQMANEQRNLAKECDEKAAKDILDYNDRQHNQNPWILDLHYLHVKEAIDALRDRLKMMESRITTEAEQQKRLKVITGKGIHSEDGAKIRPAVRKHLKQNGYDFVERDDGGSVLITLKFGED